ncbi:MAG: penicillin-binding protein 2 [Candidatus Omnitrophota bacterium]|nr:penicillin-binding protein 2 [Candidatus Omnitrophota bacterium]
MRIKLLYLAILSIFVTLLLGLVNLQMFRNKEFALLSEKNSIRLLPQAGVRGKILDRQGNMIVDNTLIYDVMVMPEEVKFNSKSFKRVAQILNVNTEVLGLTIRNQYSNTKIPMVIAKNINIKKAIALEEERSDLPSLLIQPHPVRIYPLGRLAAHLLGYLSEIDHWRLTKLEGYGYKTKDIVGFGGIEEKYDYYLRQEDGGLSVEVDRKGRFVRVLGFRQPKSGKNIGLTLDLRIQKIAEEALEGAKGSIVIMDPFSGEILAMVSRPNFNPAIFVEKSPSPLYKLFNNPQAPLFNRAISGLYPAGSTFKLIVAVAGLQSGKIKPNTSFFCNGSLNVGGVDFACWGVHGQQDIYQAIAHSCNVFIYRTGLILGPQLIYDFASKFGLGKASGIDLPYEAAGLVPNPLWRRLVKFKSWFSGDTANLSIGQGELLVTPLQMTRAIAVFANKGKLVTPYVLKSVSDKDVSSLQNKSVDLNLKPEVIDVIRQGLRKVANDADGTANVLRDLKITVAGKTGTAQTGKGNSHAWFIGFFPYESPKYAICVFLERGGHGYYSAIIAKEIIKKMEQEGIL